MILHRLEGQQEIRVAGAATEFLAVERWFPSKLLADAFIAERAWSSPPRLDRRFVPTFRAGLADFLNQIEGLI